MNAAKKLVHVIFERGVDTVIPFSETPERLSVGDSIKAKLSKSKTKYDIKYQALTIAKSDEQANTNVLKEFNSLIVIQFWAVSIKENSSLIVLLFHSIDNLFKWP